MPRTITLPLSLGSAGDDVTALQNALTALGFPVGKIDGQFGAATEAAVLGLQKSESLPPDGVVGERTASALNLTTEHTQTQTRTLTVDIASRMCPGALLRNVSANLPLLLAALNAAKLTALPIVLAAIATIRAEAAGFVPLGEQVSKFNTSPNGHDFDLYDHRKDLGNTGKPDGALYKGRGFVQLTGKANYARIGKTIGLNLIANPGQANDPAIAAQILAAFITEKLATIAEALALKDLAKARRAINGGTNGLTDFIEAYGTGTNLLETAAIAP